MHLSESFNSLVVLQNLPPFSKFFHLTFDSNENYALNFEQKHNVPYTPTGKQKLPCKSADLGTPLDRSKNGEGLSFDSVKSKLNIN